jgi:hypothetical protein
MRRSSLCTLLLLLLYLDVLPVHSAGQGPTQSPSTLNWRYRPVPITPDPPGDVANGRGQFVDSIIGLPNGIKIGSPEAANLGVGVAEHPLSMEELPRTSDVVVAGTFTSHETHKTPSGRSLYTVTYFQVDDLVSDRTGRLSIGNSLPVLFLGGTVVLPSGITASYGIPQNEDSIVFGHRYLAFLHFNPKGHHFELEKTWDISSGKAVPDSAEDKERVRTGHSYVAGNDAQTVIENLKAELAR